MATIPPKHSGLAQLADHAAANDGIERYPIKKKWEPRRLSPNWEAIRWLEDETRQLCMIEYCQVDTANPELVVQYATGRATRNYARPMFQVLPRDAFSGSYLEVTPCEACDNMAVSWACEEHTELKWDADRRTWDRPVEPTTPASTITEIYRRMEEFAGATWRDAERLYEQQQIDPHAPCRCASCLAARGRPTVGRISGTGERYSFFRDDYLTTPEVAVNPDADEMTLDEIRRYLALPNTEMNRSASFTLAVEGETIQGFAAFSLEVEDTDGQ